MKFTPYRSVLDGPPRCHITFALWRTSRHMLRTAAYNEEQEGDLDDEDLTREREYLCPANDKILNLTKVLFYKKKNLICLCSWQYVQACLHCLCCHHAVECSKDFVNLLVVKETSVCKQLMKPSYLMRSIWNKLWKPANSIPTKSNGTKWTMFIHCLFSAKKRNYS